MNTVIAAEPFTAAGDYTHRAHGSGEAGPVTPASSSSFRKTRRPSGWIGTHPAGSTSTSSTRPAVTVAADYVTKRFTPGKPLAITRTIPSRSPAYGRSWWRTGPIYATSIQRPRASSCPPRCVSRPRSLPSPFSRTHFPSSCRSPVQPGSRNFTSPAVTSQQVKPSVTAAIGSASANIRPSPPGRQQTFDVFVPEGSTTPIRPDRAPHRFRSRPRSVPVRLHDRRLPGQGTKHRARLCGIDPIRPAPRRERGKIVVDAFSVPSGNTSYEYLDVYTNPQFGSVAMSDPPQGQKEWTSKATVTAGESGRNGAVSARDRDRKDDTALATFMAAGCRSGRRRGIRAQTIHESRTSGVGGAENRRQEVERDMKTKTSVRYSRRRLHLCTDPARRRGNRCYQEDGTSPEITSAARYPSGPQVYARNVWDLQAYKGRLYIGAGNSSNRGPPASNSGPVPVNSYDPASGQFQQ